MANLAQPHADRLEVQLQLELAQHVVRDRAFVAQSHQHASLRTHHSHAHGATLGNTLLGGLVGYAFAPTGWVRIPLPISTARAARAQQ